MIKNDMIKRCKLQIPTPPLDLTVPSITKYPTIKMAIIKIAILFIKIPLCLLYIHFSKYKYYFGRMRKKNVMEERYSNGAEVHKFYCSVLDHFEEVFTRQYRYRGNIDIADFEELVELVKKKIEIRKEQEQCKDGFLNYLARQENKHQEVQKKLAHQQESYLKEKVSQAQPLTEQFIKVEEKQEEIYKCGGQEEEPKQKEEEGENKVEEKKEEVSEQSEDDLDFFIKNMESGQQLISFKIGSDKEQKSIQQHPTKHELQADLVKNQFLSYQLAPSNFDSDEEPQSSKNSYSILMSNIDQRLGSSLLGTFVPEKVKRNPKDDKIVITLENVFVKYIHLPFENYYKKVDCILDKADRKQIPDMNEK